MISSSGSIESDPTYFYAYIRNGGKCKNVTPRGYPGVQSFRSALHMDSFDKVMQGIASTCQKFFDLTRSFVIPESNEALTVRFIYSRNHLIGLTQDRIERNGFMMIEKKDQTNAPLSMEKINQFLQTSDFKNVELCDTPYRWNMTVYSKSRLFPMWSECISYDIFDRTSVQGSTSTNSLD